jgi:M6 family metalloprotease-like protein
MSIQFTGKRFEFTQPDGTALEVVGWGNQYEAVFETLDGHTVVQDPATGFYELAVPTEEGDDLQPSGIAPEDAGGMALDIPTSLRRSPEVARVRARENRGLLRGGTRWEQRLLEQKTQVLMADVLGAPPSRTTTGRYVGLVLLIEFPDVPGTISREEVEKYCNSPGYDGFGNNGSVFDYFKEVSGGSLQYTNIVAPYFTASRNRAYYTNEKVPLPKRTRELIREALRSLKASGFDFSALTLDDENCAYALNVFYAGECVNNWDKGLWPHCYYLGAKFELAKGIFAHDYQITNMGDELTLGTFCHENGHMICDFPDLYDYGNQSSGVGTYCLMCAGNNSEKNPTHVGAYLKYRAGWAATDSVSPGEYQLTAGSNELLIHSKDNSEYFIIENRARAGRDTDLPGAGIAIWHVDETGDNEHEQRTPAKHYECSLEQADGKFHLERRRDHNGDAKDLWGAGPKDFGYATTPSSKWWDGSDSRLEIEIVSSPGPTMTIRVK